MKTLGLSLVAFLLALLSGCYTEFAATHDESNADVENLSIAIIQPPPTVIVQPVLIVVPDPPMFYPPPVVIAPVPVTNPQPTSPSCDFGNTRGSASSETRPSGPTRGGR